MNRFKKIKLNNIIGILIIMVLIIPSFIYRLILKIKKKQLWLICEFGLYAKDNGYVFYKFMKEKHPEIITYFAIKKDSPDYEKVKPYGNVVEWESMKHYFIYLSANYNISSHKNGEPNHVFLMLLHMKFNLLNKFVFLQHGVIYQNFEMFHKENSKFKLFITGAKPEFDYVNEKYGYDDEVKYTGLARFDELHNAKVDDKIILYMPTWRRYLDTKKKLEDSLYYKKIMSLINSSELNKMLEEEDKYLWFCPHGGLKQLCSDFSSNNNRIKIIDVNTTDVHELLMKGVILITDFSSVHTDFAYMKKPIIYYQYDEKDYFEKHIGPNWRDTYFNFYEDGFGKVVDNEIEVIQGIQNYIKNNYKIEKMYQDRMKLFFPLYDKENSERIFKEIKKI